MAFRVPTANVSVVDLTCRLAKPAKYEEIKAPLKAASEGPMKGIIGYTEDDVVSSDFIGEPCTCVIDAKACIEQSFRETDCLVRQRVGYSCKVLDLIMHMAGVESGSARAGQFIASRETVEV